MLLRTSAFRQPFPRRFLLRLHYDLFQICRFARWDIDKDSGLSLVEKMVLISEDRRFFRHNGVDCIACAREATRLVTFRRHGGASTIDMQFVRTATGYYERTMGRKLYEIALAWLIQFKYSKIEILRFYLRRAFFGSHMYGVEAASRKVFSKSSDQLELSEAAFVAAMLVYPRPQIRQMNGALR